MTENLIKSPRFGDNISLRPQDPNASKPAQFGPGFAEFLYGPTQVFPHFFATYD
jgi:hypothetical protein